LQNFTYGTKTQYLSTSTDPFTHELFESTNTDYDDDSSSDTETMAFLDRNGDSVREKFTRPQFTALFGPTFKMGPKPVGVSSKPKAVTTSTSGADTALAQLQNSLASEGQRKADNT
jgi:RNA polymerase II elongation factor ELL